MATSKSARKEISETTTPKRRRTTRNAASSINYDQKYHPMDDVMRPSAAAARRAAHDLLGTPGPSTTSESIALLEQSDDSHGSIEDTNAREVDAHPKPIGQTVPHGSGSPSNRRGTRERGEKPSIYDMSYHPLDDVMPLKKSRKPLDPKPSPKLSTTVRDTSSSPPRKHHQMDVVTRSKKSMNVLARAAAAPNGSTSIGSHASTGTSRPEYPHKTVTESELAVVPPSDMSATAALESATGGNHELHYAEGFDVYDCKVGEKYWNHRKDSIVQLGRQAIQQTGRDRLLSTANEATGHIHAEKTARDDDRDSYDSSYNDAKGYIRQTLGCYDSETQESPETELLASLRNQPSNSIDDMMELAELAPMFQPPVEDENDSKGKEPIRPSGNSSLYAGANDHELDSGERRRPLQGRFNITSTAEHTFSVHEDQPGNTPKIKRQVAMYPKSPGTDIPKENWHERSPTAES
ncbi:MAG: hypothetical protein Q9178_006658 [Gyalolechia marmorata]